MDDVRGPLKPKVFPGDQDEDLLDSESESVKKPKPPKVKSAPPPWAQLLNIAGSVAGLTAISLLTFEMSIGSVRLGVFAAYAFGSSILIGILLLVVILFRWALNKIQTSLWRYTFWFLGLPFAFLYYILFVFLIYGFYAPLLVRMMEAAFGNAP